MYEDRTAQNILNEMLDAVTLPVDKREGSVLYNALAPVASVCALLYGTLDRIAADAFADTAGLDKLILRAKERGVQYRDATAAVVSAEITTDGDPIFPGDRFFIDNIYFVFLGAQSDDGSEYLLTCETVGSAGNISSGNLIYDGGQTVVRTARITGIVLTGRDAETEDAFRARYYDSLDNAAFGGNVADYREKTLALPGVGGVKVVRPSVDDEPGHVRLLLLGDEQTIEETVKRVQTYFTGENGNDGIAPVGHIVECKAVQTENVTFTLSLSYYDGYNFERVQQDVKQTIQQYCNEVAQAWADTGAGVVKRSEVFARLLPLDGIADVLSVVMTDKSGAEQTEIVFAGDTVPEPEVAGT